MLRMGVYCKYKGKLFRCTVYDNYSKVVLRSDDETDLTNIYLGVMFLKVKLLIS